MVTDLLIHAAGQSGQLVSLACVKIKGLEYASQNVLGIARFSSRGSDTWTFWNYGNLVELTEGTENSGIIDF